MRIEVIGDETESIAQARAYAEYRLFATLARHARLIRCVHVVLEQVERDGLADRVRCAVEVMFEPSGSACISAHAPHPRAAIDRAAERAGHFMHRRPPNTVSS